jgi:hypothetical protein
MATPQVVESERCTAFLGSVDTKKIFRVPRNLFPLAIDPAWVTSREAYFMRPSDWVIGVRVREEARCYPAWIMDNYHAVNDTLGRRHIAVMHCEICCSNAVYIADLEGQRLTFGTAGLYGGTLAVYDTQTNSTWSHGMGVAFEGELRGAALPALQSFQATWEEWLSYYPETTVMAWNSPAIHPDGRHGHGARDTFAHAGMYVEPVSSMIVGNDNRLPEHEMVLTLNLNGSPAAIPLREIARAGGLFQSDIGGLRLVTISAGQASALVGTFHRHLPGDRSKDLDFVLIDGIVYDRQTGSTWRADGVAIDGKLKGRRLHPVPTMINKWHSLACFIPKIEILTHQKEPAPISMGEARAVVDALIEAHFMVSIDYELYKLELPNSATRGFHLHIDEDPFDLLIFDDEAAARDTALGYPHALQSRRLLLASSPDKRFKDDLNVSPLPDEEVAWSTLLSLDYFCDAVRAGAAKLEPHDRQERLSIDGLVNALRGTPYEITSLSCCPRDAIPPRAAVGIQASIQADPFIIYRFAEAADAESYSHTEDHVRVIGPFALRSDPDVYVIPKPLSTMRKPDEAIGWSNLLADDEFIRSLQSYVRQAWVQVAASHPEPALGAQP